MLELSPAVTKLFHTIPTSDLHDDWHDKVLALCAAINAEKPQWLDGCPAGISADPTEWDLVSWHIVLIHLVNHGMKLQVGNCRSYWFIKNQTSKWACIDGEHKLIELCYVSLYGDTFSGHATEYYPSHDAANAIRALRRRMVDDLTTRDSGFGHSVEEAIRLNLFNGQDVPNVPIPV
ncbi:hypothetical protein D3C87_970410 [compost metagenome]